MSITMGTQSLTSKARVQVADVFEATLSPGQEDLYKFCKWCNIHERHFLNMHILYKLLHNIHLLYRGMQAQYILLPRIVH